MAKTMDVPVITLPLRDQHHAILSPPSISSFHSCYTQFLLFPSIFFFNTTFDSPQAQQQHLHNQSLLFSLPLTLFPSNHFPFPSLLTFPLLYHPYYSLPSFTPFFPSSPSLFSCVPPFPSTGSLSFPPSLFSTLSSLSFTPFFYSLLALFLIIN